MTVTREKLHISVHMSSGCNLLATAVVQQKVYGKLDFYYDAAPFLGPEIIYNFSYIFSPTYIPTYLPMKFVVLCHLSIIGTLIKSPVCSRTYEIPKKIGIPKKTHIKFQKKRGKKLEFQKKIHMKFQIVRGKIGICRFFLNWSGFEPIY